MQRTIRIVDFDWPRGPVSIEQLMSMPIAQWEHIRTEITKRRQETPSEPLGRCRLCGGSVFIKTQSTLAILSPYFAHFADAPDDCPWHHGPNLRPDDARASQYQGQQESALHRWLCNQVAELVGADPRARDICVDTYRRPTIEGRGRWPDVYFEIEGLARFAIEIQLSKPFAPEVVARQLFYDREGISLVWLFRSLSDPMPQGFRDVLTLQRGNAFTIGDDVLRASRAKGQLLFDCHLEAPRGGFLKPKRISLDDLTLEAGRSVFLTDRRTEALRDYCKAGRIKWANAFRTAPGTTSKNPFSEPIYHSAWDSARMYVPALSAWKQRYWQTNGGSGGGFFCELIAVLFSIAHSGTGGSDRLYLTRFQGSEALLQMLNAKLAGRFIMPYATLIETFLTASARAELLSRESLATAVRQAKLALPQIGADDPTWLAAVRIFPEILDGVRRQEMIDVKALPFWAGGTAA